jgi:hypothetical protein
MIERIRGLGRKWHRDYDEWRMQLSDQQFAAIRSTVIAGVLLVAGGGVYFFGKPV